MILRFAELSGPIRFSSTEIVWIRVQFTKDNVDVQHDFLQFLIKIPRPVSSTSGGGFFAAGFYPEDAPRVRAWLEERAAVGVKLGCEGFARLERAKTRKARSGR
jgi:hypothetical protein